MASHRPLNYGKISTNPRDGFGPTYVNVELKCKCDSELMDFLKEVLFHLIGCLTWIDGSFYLWNENA